MNTNQQISRTVILCFAASAIQSLAQTSLADEIDRRNIERRAVEAVIWGMPAANFDLMYQAMIRDAKAEEAKS